MEPGGEPMVLGMASDDVLAALATVVRRPRKRANIGLAVATQQEPRASSGPTQLSRATAAPPARVWPDPSIISSTQLQSTTQNTVATTPSPRPSTTQQMQLPCNLATAQEATARDRPGRSIISPIQLPTTSEQVIIVDTDPELDSETPVSGRSMAKRKEMAEFWRNSKGCTLADVSRVGRCSANQAAEWVVRDKRGEELMIKPKGRKPQWPVPKAVVEIAKVLPEIHLTNDVISRAAEAVGIPNDNFRYIQSEVKTRLQTTVVDLWFGGDSRGERELAAAVGRRVNILLVVDLKKSRASGLEGVKALLEAGVQVCHCTEDLQCRAAIFDGQILVQGSQSWTENNQESSSMDYSMVLTGPIVSDFECQFD
ncbi:hypothetical protein PR003_g29962 [Phytophthora rubi]|uniref:Phospholipase D-like domain-containing protein n=1 Tax=Phytophthora rubi TaxID=129364 RepID=A0A6A3H7D9_9STRA|nr:hypothetical protein PR002_g28832 [Phytophthora rubi]KAE9273249.1 hypothetical protein PR003_g29962 [Phytophthora rubi]